MDRKDFGTLTASASRDHHQHSGSEQVPDRLAGALRAVLWLLPTSTEIAFEQDDIERRDSIILDARAVLKTYDTAKE